MKQMSFMDNRKKLVAGRLVMEDEYLVFLTLFLTKPWFVFNRDCSFVQEGQDIIHCSSIAKAIAALPKRSTTLVSYFKKRYPRGIPQSFKFPSSEEYSKILSFLKAVNEDPRMDIKVIV